MIDWRSWIDWWQTLAPEAALLVLLPFAVAVVGLLAEARRPRRQPRGNGG